LNVNGNQISEPFAKCDANALGFFFFTPTRLSRQNIPPIHRARAELWLIPILLLAAFLRLYQLQALPPGFHFDLAFNALDIARLMQGDLRIFFPANTGREPLFIYLQTVPAFLIGLTPFALRLTSAFIGLVTIPILYGFAKSLFPSRAIGLLAALFGAISFWHIFFSRDGLRVILVVPLTLLFFWFLWLAIQRANRRDFILSGTALALAFYTYPSARLLPIALLLLVGFASWMQPKNARTLVVGALWSLFTAFLLLLPLAVYFYFHPNEFFSHTLQVSLLSPDAADQNVLLALWENTRRIAGMFFVAGDTGLIRNLPGRPICDPFLALFFLGGVALLARDLFCPRALPAERMRAFLLTVWIGLALATSWISDDAPNFLRTLPMFPVMMLLPAWACVRLWRRAQKFNLRVVYLSALVVGISASAWLTFHDYFETFARLPGTYYAYDVDMVEIAQWVNARSQNAQVYLAPLYAQQGTILFLTRNALLKSFDSRDTIVLPPRANGREAYYAFPPEQAPRVKTLAERVGVGERADVIGSNGAPILLVYHIPAHNLPTTASGLANAPSDFLKPTTPIRASWENKLDLFGARIEALGTGSRQLSVTLMLHALETMSQDFVFSVKVRGQDDTIWGQQDKMPGSNSFPTTQWTPGEIVVERFTPEFDACPPPGSYTITVEVYAADDGKALMLDNQNANVLELAGVRARSNCVWSARNGMRN
jgi:4-amino-4-deoxy-L-arabinose transferase-like glycosyltransferase